MGMFDDLRAGKLQGGSAPAKRSAGNTPAPAKSGRYEAARQAFEAARPDIEAGKLPNAYPTWAHAEAALEQIRREDEAGGSAPETPPAETGAGPVGSQTTAAPAPAPKRRTMFDELRARNGVAPDMPNEERRAMTHPAAGTGMVKPSWQSPVAMTQPNVRGVQQAMQAAQTHGAVGAGGGAPLNDSMSPEAAADRLSRTTGVQPDQTMLAPRGERLASAQILQTGARMGIEAAVTHGSGALLRRLAPEAGPLLKTGAAAVGNAAGSLIAEPIDPSEDPLAMAGYSGIFAAIGDSLALGYSAARRSMAESAATRADRLVPGAQDAIDQLGPGNLPTAGRLTTTSAVDTAENVAEKSILGGRFIRARNERARRRAEAQIREEVSKYVRGKSREEVDQLVTDVMTGSNQTYRAMGQGLYRELDGLAQEGVSTDALIKLRNGIVREFANKAERDDLEPLIQAVDLVLGVPESQRGIKRGMMLDVSHRPEYWDPKKPGAVVTEGADPMAVMMQPQGYVTDPVTGLPVRSGAAQAPQSGPVRIEGGGIAGEPTGQAGPTRFTTDPKTGELIELAPEAVPPASITGGLPPSAQEAPGVPKTTQMFGGWVQGQPNAKGSITFEDMNSLRSAMLAVGREGNALIPEARRGQAKRLAGVADETLTMAGASLRNPEAFEAWRSANAFWKDLHETFDDNVMIALANSRPDDVFNTIMRRDSPRQIGRFHKMVFGGLGGDETTSAGIRRAAKATLNDARSSPAQKALAAERIRMSLRAEKVWTQFQGRYLMRLLEQSDAGAGIESAAAAGGRDLSGKKLLSGWNAFGKDANAQVFPSARQRRNAERLFKTLEITQSGTGTDTAKLAIQFGQFQSMIGIMLKPGTPGAWFNALVFLIGPEALAKLADNEQFIRWVTTSKTVKTTSEEFNRAVANMAAIATKEGARVILPNGDRFEPTEETPRAREARELLDIANRRGGF